MELQTFTIKGIIVEHINFNIGVINQPWNSYITEWKKHVLDRKIIADTRLFYSVKNK